MKISQNSLTSLYSLHYIIVENRANLAILIKKSLSNTRLGWHSDKRNIWVIHLKRETSARSPEGIALSIVKINITTSQSIFIIFIAAKQSFLRLKACDLLYIITFGARMETFISPIAPGTGHTRAHKLRGRPADPASRKRRQVKTKDSGGGGGDKCATQNSRVTKQCCFLRFCMELTVCVFAFCVTDSKQVRCSLFDCWFGFELQQFFVLLFFFIDLQLYLALLFCYHFCCWDFTLKN